VGVGGEVGYERELKEPVEGSRKKKGRSGRSKPKEWDERKTKIRQSEEN
jgi:hypothetical protein